MSASWPTTVRPASGLMGAAVAAHGIDYDSPPQFTRDYRRPFGAPPIKDAAALRARLDGTVSDPGRRAPVPAHGSVRQAHLPDIVIV